MPIIDTWVSDEDYAMYLMIKGHGKGEWTKFIHRALSQPKKDGEPSVVGTSQDPEDDWR